MLNAISIGICPHAYEAAEKLSKALEMQAEPPAPQRHINNLRVMWGRRFHLPSSFSAAS